MKSLVVVLDRGCLPAHCPKVQFMGDVLGVCRAGKGEPGFDGRLVCCILP